MNIKDYQTEWSKDCKIDYARVHEESLNISVLHSKYMNFLSSERLKYRSLTEKKKKLESKLHDYYEGIIDGKDIGREPFQIRLATKTQVDKRVDNDIETVKVNLEVAFAEENVLFLKEVINAINQRSFNIRNYIEYVKFSGGSL
jgi:hypothetical protein